MTLIDRCGEATHYAGTYMTRYVRFPSVPDFRMASALFRSNHQPPAPLTCPSWNVFGLSAWVTILLVVRSAVRMLSFF